MTTRPIVDVVAAVEAVLGRGLVKKKGCRDRDCVIARQMTMYFARGAGHSYGTIARVLGGLNHSTVIQGYKRFTEKVVAGEFVAELEAVRLYMESPPKHAAAAHRAKLALDVAEAKRNMDIIEQEKQETDKKRERLPHTRDGVTMHFVILTKAPKQNEEDPDRLVEVDAYLTTGLYEDGRLGEFFVRVGAVRDGSVGGAELSKELAALGPMMDEWAKMFSMALQHGASVNSLCAKSIATRFEPAGRVLGVEGITRCTSPTDLICRFLKRRYGEPETESAVEEGAES